MTTEISRISTAADTKPLKASEVHKSLESEFPDVHTRHRVVRTLVSRFPAHIEDDSNGLLANASTPSSVSAARDEAHVAMTVAHCRRKGIDIDPARGISRYELERVFRERASDFPLSERFAIKASLNRVGLLAGPLF